MHLSLNFFGLAFAMLPSLASYAKLGLDKCDEVIEQEVVCLDAIATNSDGYSLLVQRYPSIIK